MIARRAVHAQADGTVIVRGGGWFWARIDEAGNVQAQPEGASAKTSWRGWLRDAKAAAKQAFEEAGA